MPEGWEWSTLGELFYLQAGKNISANQISETKKDNYIYPCYGGNGLRGYVTNYNKEGLHPLVGRQGALCGNVNISSHKFYATEHAVVVDTFAKTDFYWCVYSLLQLNLNQYATATAQPGLSVNKINEVLIPLPPLAEQNRISANIERWFALIDKLETNQVYLQNAIKQAKAKILDLAIHGKLVPQDPNDEPAIEIIKRINPDFTPCDNSHYEQLPQSWSKSCIGDIFFHNTGKALNSSNTVGVMMEYLTTSNVYWNHFDFRAVKKMFFKENELEKCTIRSGDLLVCEGGDIGRSAIWNYDYNICIQNHIHRLRPIDNRLSVEFYYYVFKYLKDNHLIESKGIGLLGLSPKELHKICVPVPPIYEQDRISKKINELFSIMDRIMESL